MTYNRRPVDTTMIVRILLLVVAASWAGTFAAGQNGATESEAARSSAPTEEELLEGKRLYLDAACFNCHGQRGQGGGGIDFPPGPSLRASTLNRDAMILFVRCGVPGSPMSGWLMGAYTENQCYAFPVGPPPAGTTVRGIFTEEEIGILVDYIRYEFMRIGE